MKKFNLKKFLAEALSRDQAFSLKMGSSKGLYFANRIHQALVRGDRIFVYGDYDVDGMLSTSQTIEMIEDFAEVMGYRADIEYRLPGRAEGYGIDYDYFQYLCKDHDLIITCDNGTHEEFYSKLREDDFGKIFILDHHPNGDFSSRLNVINPNSDGSVKISTGLIGEYLFQSLRQAFPKYGAVRDEDHFRDYTAITLLSDMADRNHPVIRKLIHDGLVKIGQRERALYRFLFPDFRGDKSPVSAEDVVFALNPLLNSAGRVGVDLDWIPPLLHNRKGGDSFDRYMLKMIDINEFRKELSNHYIQQASRIVESQMERGVPPVVFVAMDDCPIGLNGLIAGSLSQKYSVDVVFLSINVHGDGEFIGSGRGGSVKAHIDAMVNRYPELAAISEYGGHDAAIGIRIKDIGKFMKHAEAYLRDPAPVPDFHQKTVLPVGPISPKEYANLCREYGRICNGIAYDVDIIAHVSARIVGYAEYRNDFIKVLLGDENGEIVELISKRDHRLDVDSLSQMTLALSLRPWDGKDTLFADMSPVETATENFDLENQYQRRM